MNWSTFKQQLLAHTGQNLRFQYTENDFVDTSYHLTEIKQASINSVDCGGKFNAWTEIILQLWEPENQTGGGAMSVAKAVSIINLVEASLPLHPNAEVKIEFGNSAFEMRQMLPFEMHSENNILTVKLISGQTGCKAIDRGETCGKPKVALAELNTNANAACAPGSGCCG